MAKTETVKRSANFSLPPSLPATLPQSLPQRRPVSDMKQHYRQTVLPTDTDNDLTFIALT